jgi:hypothetical protein
MDDLKEQDNTMETLLKQILTELRRQNNRNGRTSPDSPYLTLEEAAIYARYQKKPFSRLVKEYQIPKCGPHNNRYKKYDLDRWMDDPNCFKTEALSGKKGKRSEDPMARIFNMLLKMASDGASDEEWKVFREELKKKISDEEWEAFREELKRKTSREELKAILKERSKKAYL